MAVCQMDAAAGDRAARLAMIESTTRDAKSHGAALVVFPELAVTGYGVGTEMISAAETRDGPIVALLSNVARIAHTFLVAGLPMAEDGKVYNGAVCATPDGDVVLYRKIHLYGDYEKELFSPGTCPPPIMEIQGLKCGLLVCFDVEFPERVRDLALRGAQAVLVPTALPASDEGAFIAGSVVPVRAFENQVFIAYANHVGTDGRFAYQGQSCIAAPDGRLLARADGTRAATIIADLDPGAYAASRREIPISMSSGPHPSDRRERPKYYGEGGSDPGPTIDARSWKS